MLLSSGHDHPPPLKMGIKITPIQMPEGCDIMALVGKPYRCPRHRMVKSSPLLLSGRGRVFFAEKPSVKEAVKHQNCT